MQPRGGLGPRSSARFPLRIDPKNRENVVKSGFSTLTIGFRMINQRPVVGLLILDSPPVFGLQTAANRLWMIPQTTQTHRSDLWRIIR